MRRSRSSPCCARSSRSPPKQAAPILLARLCRDPPEPGASPQPREDLPRPARGLASRRRRIVRKFSLRGSRTRRQPGGAGRLGCITGADVHHARPRRVEHGRGAVFVGVRREAEKASCICGTRARQPASWRQKRQISRDPLVVHLDGHVAVDGAPPGHDLEGVARVRAAPGDESVSRRSSVRRAARPRARRRRRTKSGTSGGSQGRRSAGPAGAALSTKAGAGAANTSEASRATGGAGPSAQCGQARAQGVACGAALVEDDHIVAARPIARPRERLARLRSMASVVAGFAPSARTRDGGVRRARRRREPEQPGRPDAVAAPHRKPQRWGRYIGRRRAGHWSSQTRRNRPTQPTAVLKSKTRPEIDQPQPTRRFKALPTRVGP